MNRRRFLCTSAAGSLALTALPSLAELLKAGYPAVRAITKGPAFHWFGYYDKWQFDPSGRYVLGNQVDFEHRSPAASDKIRVGIIDLQDKDRWIPLGESSAWGWQQGCMLQWIPGSKTEVIWNDRQGDQFVSHIVDIKTGKKRTLPKPIYALSPDGKWAIGTDFARINNMRPGYGYAGIPDVNEQIKAPENAGLYRLDLKKGTSKLIIPFATLGSLPHKEEILDDYWHWFNHLLFSPDGKRFVFLHRWRKEMGERAARATGGFITRMVTANLEGRDAYVLDPSGFTSHFIWRNPNHICAWTRPEGQKDGFYLFQDKTGKVEQVGAGKMVVNGHNTYLPVGNKMDWILNDTYPDKNRMQTPYIYHIPTDKRIDLGQFNEPAAYKGEFRCDLHPRYSPDGTKVVIDSVHGGNGRQMYLIDIKDLIS